MKELKDIIAKNLVELRKKNNLTQNELAEKLNYSDNTISRWEHGEITPSIESLEAISKIYDIPLENLLKENAAQNNEIGDKTQLTNRIVTIILCVCQVWFIATICYFYIKTFQHINYWLIFVWAVPISCAVIVLFSYKLKLKLVTFIACSVFIWTLLTSIYLQLLQYNIYLIFIIGIPTQVSLAIWTFLRKKNNSAT